MKISCIILALSFMLYSCAAGPVYMAKNETEGIKTTYDDKRAQELYSTNATLLKEIYDRYDKARINVYNEGIGITTMKDSKSERLYFLMANVRPQDFKFDMNTTTSQKRFSYGLMEIPNYFKYLKSSDLEKDGIQGLEVGIYWGVKDYKKCDQYGGFIEYVQVFFKKADAQDVLEGRKSYKEALESAEVVTSLDLKPSVSVRPTF